MTDPIPTVRAAAARLRALAGAAAEASGTDTWTASHRHAGAADLTAGPGRRLLHGGGGRGAGHYPFVLPAVADYVAAMGPAAGIALAALLERTASEADEDGHEQCGCAPDACSLAAAAALARHLETDHA
ncbi:hypothetical protein RM844_28845 [Streptomyces sp. DSM 44915]|uniref:Uncharacterized protein n=1 Tax=Streptomyces chisholmiae TaxID=3075540 RepID=A0ABU2K0H0_9ACTN|nr:hypothetical protein [Streptomyces sp. DSM 44915]MDT0270274.1 hypothetical protein [Streptomyces sp. DSM 44915]MDT0270286.1 hypothetical protein [Streptomyces sp. DSM 44915]